MREPFPHVLGYSKGVIRFVTDSTIQKGDTISEKSITGVPGQSFQIDQVQLIREAKGDWTKWPTHPNYYEAKAHLV